MNKERLISEALKPDLDAPPALDAVLGEPMLPSRFRWRGKDLEVAEVLGHWKESGPCTSGGGERYLRKHWFHVRCADGQEMKLYFERQPRSKSTAKSRWWLYTLCENGEGASQ